MRNRRNLWIATAVLVAASGLAAVLLLSRSSGLPEGALLDPGNRNLVTQGSKIYAEICASCHGRNLEGQSEWQTRDAEGYLPGPPHDETGHTWHHPDKLLFDITKLGVAEAANLEDYETRMPAFEGVLKDGEIIAVLSFIKARWPKQVRQRHDEMNRRFHERRGGGQ